MHRTNIYLTERQVERLEAESERTGLSSAEIVRRAVDFYLDAPIDNEEITLKYKGYVATIAAGFQVLRRTKQVMYYGTAKWELGTMRFGAESLRDCQDLFRWMVDRIPEQKRKWDQLGMKVESGAKP